MDWSQSYSAKWKIYRVNRDTWADGEQVSKVESASVSKTSDGSLLETGSMEVIGDFARDYYRIVMVATQGGETMRCDVATLLFEAVSGKADHGITVHSVDGRSVLYPASVTAITFGDYAPAGVNGAEYAAELLRGAINAPVVVDGSFTLNENVVHEIGSTVLSAAWSVLNAGGFVMQIDGKGVVHIRPKPTEPALIINNATIKNLCNGIDIDSDMSEIPNRYVVADDIIVTVASNNDSGSVVSIPSRGYTVDEIDTSPTLVNSETYAQYAERRLHEVSVLKEERSYQREYAPDVMVYSIVRGSIKGLEGDFRVSSQSIKCDHGIVVEEKAYKETYLW